MVTELEARVVRIVVEGDTRIVYDEILTLAWISQIDAVRNDNVSIWTITLSGHQPTPTDLLRVVLADRRLQVIEFHVLRSAE